MATKEKARRVNLNEIPEMKPADFVRARPMRELMPDVVAAMKRGRPKSSAPKERVSLHLDPKIVAAYKATGLGWQRRIAEALARAAPQLKKARARKHAA